MLCNTSLSIRPPWSYAFFDSILDFKDQSLSPKVGVKCIENRKWEPRGSLKTGDRFMIHSSQKWDEGGERFLEGHGIPLLPPEFYPAGLIGDCVFQGTVTDSDDPYFIGPIGWQVSDAREYPVPIAIRGELGLWKVPQREFRQAQKYSLYSAKQRRNSHKNEMLSRAIDILLIQEKIRNPSLNELKWAEQRLVAPPTELADLIEPPFMAGIPPTLYTFGYRNQAMNDFRSLAPGALLVDVRFKNTTKHWGHDQLYHNPDILYFPMTSLGNINYHGGKRGPRIQISNARLGIPILDQLLRMYPVIVMCACEDYHTCHRKKVVELLNAWRVFNRKTPVTPIHL